MGIKHGQSTKLTCGKCNVVASTRRMDYVKPRFKLAPMVKTSLIFVLTLQSREMEGSTAAATRVRGGEEGGVAGDGRHGGYCVREG
jgi:hypothetical protein